MSSEVLKARSRLALTQRKAINATADQVVEAKRDLAAAKLANYVERIVASAPPLTDEQRDRIAALLRAGAA